MAENLLDDGLKTPLIQQQGINKYSYIAQIFIWLGVFFGCALLAQLVSSVVLIAFYGLDVTKIINMTNGIGDLNGMRFAQLFATIVMFLLPALIFSRLKQKDYLSYSNATQSFPAIGFLLIPLLIYTFYPIINLSFFINKMAPWSDWMYSSQIKYKAITEGLMKDTSISVLIFNLIIVALLPGICEEWIFRGTLQKLFAEKLNIHLSIFLAAVIFSLIHFDFSGFLPRMILGMLLGYLFYYSGSLWVNIFAHVLNNGTVVLVTYLSTTGVYKGNTDNPEMPKTWEIIAYTAAFAVLWYIFYHFSQKRKKSNFAPQTSL